MEYAAIRHPLDIERITLAFHRAQALVPKETYLPSPGRRHAAVATILRPGAHNTAALFILRAKKEGDPWSGQMAFPGGHYEAGDRSLRHTAERETFEEIGLNLVTQARYIGKLEDVQARGRQHSMPVSPFVYVLQNQAAAMSPNYEVDNILWGSLNDIYAGAAATTHYADIMGKTEALPGYNVGDQVVWGLTLRILENFFTQLSRQAAS